MARRTNKNLAPPCWEDGPHSVTMIGGRLAEIPKPHVRYFGPENPKPPKREVEVKLYSWCNIGSFGAKHLYAELKEEENPIWNAARSAWQFAWDDQGKAGRHFEAEFIYGRDEAAADEWIRKNLAEHFPRRRFEYVFGMRERFPRKWIQRPGD